MPLRNKDGTPYRTLSQPNPLLQEQDHWTPADDDVVLHNIGKTEKPAPPPEPAPTPPGPAPPVEPPPPQPAPPAGPPLTAERIDSDQAVVAWCLPVVPKEDGEPTWGTKFRFECLFSEVRPYSMTVWTKSRRVTLGSVLFPSTHAKTGNPVEMYRWWKVGKTREYGGGILVSCVPSDVSPDFSA